MRTKRVHPRAGGFTLIELLAASLVTALVAGAATVATSQLVRLKSRSLERAQAMARADAAASRLALDLGSVSRDADLRFALVRVTPGAGSAGRADELLLVARSRRGVRGTYGVPEGGEFSVQYRLGPMGATTALWRRANMAVFSIPDSGGIAAPVTPGVAELRVEACDGSEWFASWDSDAHGLPHAVRVTAVGVSDSGRTFATARRVVAIPRVPVPADPASEEVSPSAEPASEAGSSSAPAGGGGR